MARTRLMTLLTGSALVAVIALVAGCGGSGGGATAATPKASPKPTIAIASSGLGTILVDSQGHTLYMFNKDSGMTSACSGECATAWPPLLVKGKPTVGNGANASLVGTITRTDGTTQVTYGGHPLYRFVEDQNSGETNGEGLTAFGGSWFAVSPAGNQIAKQSSSGAASSPQPAKPAAPKVAAPKPAAPKPAPEPVAPKAAPKRAAPPASKPPAPETAPKQEAPSSNGIPQNNGGDGDSDNNGGPSDGDGNV